MTSNKPKPITLHDADKNRALIGLSVSGLGGVWVENCEGGMPSGLVRLSPEDARTLRDWLTDYLGDEDDTDKTPDDDGWEDADWQGDNPPRPGDEVEATGTVNGMTVIHRGTYDHLGSFKEVRDPSRGVIGRDIFQGTWRVRRAPDLDPDDVLTPGTIIRDAKTGDIRRTTVAQVDNEAGYAIGPWSGGKYEVPIDELVAFTVEATGDRWEKKDGRWTVTSAEGIRDALNGGRE